MWPWQACAGPSTVATRAEQPHASVCGRVASGHVALQRSQAGHDLSGHALLAGLPLVGDFFDDVYGE